MNQYNVYRHEARGFEAVPEGFSLGAAIFQPWWLLFHRMYAYAALVLGIQGVAIFFLDQEGSTGAAKVAVFALTAVVLGIAGNDLRRRSLSKRGFEHVGAFEALAEGNAVEDAQKKVGN